ncbi:putative nuclease HARBI1 [Ixodes scapularis]
MEVYSDREFSACYRFSKTTVRELLCLLCIRPSTDDSGKPLSPMLQLLVALRFYGAGAFQTVIGDLINVSQPTVCRVVGNITDLIIQELFPKVVQFPDATGRRSVTHAFYKIGKFPGVSGCIDCTHVRIKSPGGDDAEVFRNRKGYFSINVQAITGPELQFFDVVASWPGSVHDSRIFDNCRAKVLYEEAVMTGVLLGDMGYACTPYLMTPFADPGKAGSPHDRYNKAHIKTRNSIERAFGVWKRRFPCLDMRLQHKPERSAGIITACAALHNLGRQLLDPCPPAVPLPPLPKPRRRRPLPPLPRLPADTGTNVRNTIIARHFT